MTDYECPTCGGGFPATAHDGACPWCGEDMDGKPSARIETSIGALTPVNDVFQVRSTSSTDTITPEDAVPDDLGADRDRLTLGERL